MCFVVHEMNLAAYILSCYKSVSLQAQGAVLIHTRESCVHWGFLDVVSFIVSSGAWSGQDCVQKGKDTCFPWGLRLLCFPAASHIDDK